MFQEDRQRIAGIGRGAASTLRVHEYLQRKPYLSIAAAVQALGISTPTVTTSLRNLEKLGIAVEATGRQRGRMFVYERYLEILSEGTEPLRG